MRVFCLIMLLWLQVLHAEKTKILTCDGGGVRGVATLKMMQLLEKETEVKCHGDFDVFAGTSTGSIIAMALAAGLTVDEILEDYQKMSAQVFTRATYFTAIETEYDANVLKENIVKIMQKKGYGPDATLGQLKKKIVIPTVSLRDPKTKRYQLEIRENFTEEGKKAKVVDVIMQSTAAPTYFPSEGGCIDGGIGMNDPSLAALMISYKAKPANLSDFSVLSVGTGYDLDSIKGDESWGVMQWISGLFGGSGGSVPLLEILMDVQQQIPSQVCSAFLGNSYFKVNFPLTTFFGLDEYEKIPHLIAYTEEFTKREAPYWNKACNWLRSNVTKSTPAQKNKSGS